MYRFLFYISSERNTFNIISRQNPRSCNEYIHPPITIHMLGLLYINFILFYLNTVPCTKIYGQNVVCWFRIKRRSCTQAARNKHGTSTEQEARKLHSSCTRTSTCVFLDWRALLATYVLRSNWGCGKRDLSDFCRNDDVSFTLVLH
jgi:hypothetical protein